MKLTFYKANSNLSFAHQFFPKGTVRERSEWIDILPASVSFEDVIDWFDIVEQEK